MHAWGPCHAEQESSKAMLGASTAIPFPMHAAQWELMSLPGSRHAQCPCAVAHSYRAVNSFLSFLSEGGIKMHSSSHTPVQLGPRNGHLTVSLGMWYGSALFLGTECQRPS